MTGLEPATCFPTFKANERAAGRVVTLPVGGKWETAWIIEVFDTAEAVAAAVAEVDAIQADVEPVIRHAPIG